MSVELKYRRKLLRARARQEASLRSAFIKVSKEFAKKFGNSPIIRNDEGFLFRSHPKLNKELTAMMGKFETELYQNITGGIKSAWEIANDMNDEYVNYYFKGLGEFRKEKNAVMDLSLIHI